MPLKKAIEKLKKYYTRLDAGEASKIKPNHVEKVIGKLIAKQESLLEELDATKKTSKKARLERKLATTREQIERANWLLEKISESAN